MSTNEMVRENVASEKGSEEESVQIVISPQEQAERKLTDDGSTGKHYKKLYKAALKDDWKTAIDIYEKYEDYIRAPISEGGDTALHIAAAANSSAFVLELVARMEPDDLAIRNRDGRTAFCLVAASGKLELARAMLRKNHDLPLIYDTDWTFPLQMAAQSCHKQMVEFLYDVTKHELIEVDRTDIFHTLITTCFYDFALNLLKEHPYLATAFSSNEETALHILARTSMKSSYFANQNQEGIWKRCFNLFLGSYKFRDEKLHLALELVKRLWDQVKDLDATWISEVIFVAAAQGNVEFLTRIIRDYPELILKVDKDNYSIFHVAVLNRQKDIFKLIYQISPPFKSLILQKRDRQQNNILHLAGMLAPPDRLNTVSGVALQLQEELLWFEEVRKIFHPLDTEAKNTKGKTPRALFTEMHRGLKDKGEKWMKETANSCMIVATLIATVVFAAAFTVPGGTEDNTGTPHFIQKLSFTIFVISDAVSLVTSASSILTFLSILTSRYAEKDFLSVLPRKLFVGLSTLLLSIAAMMVVFCATIFIVFKDGMIWVPIVVSVIASLPVIMFTMQQWRLLFDVACSTFKFNSLFHSSNHNLFDDEGKETKPNKLKYCFLCCWTMHLQACATSW